MVSPFFSRCFNVIEKSIKKSFLLQLLFYRMGNIFDVGC